MSIFDSIKALTVDKLDDVAIAAINAMGIEDMDVSKFMGIVEKFGLADKLPSDVQTALVDGTVTKEEMRAILDKMM